MIRAQFPGTAQPFGLVRTTGQTIQAHPRAELLARGQGDYDLPGLNYNSKPKLT